jgi:hypothetical protein
MRHQRPFVNVIVDSFLKAYHSNIFTTARVGDWLFDGIDDPVLDVANEIPFLPISIPYDKFGWFYTVSFCYFLSIFYTTCLVPYQGETYTY